MFANLLFLNGLCFQRVTALSLKLMPWAVAAPLLSVSIQCNSVCVLAIAAFDLYGLVLHRLGLVKLLFVDADDPVISNQVGGFGLAIQNSEIFGHPGQPLYDHALERGNRCATMFSIWG